MRKHHPVEHVDHLENRYIGPFDPRDQIIGQVGRRGDAAVAEQLDDQLAEQGVVRRSDLDLRRGGEPRAQVRKRDLPVRRRRVGDDQQRLAARLGIVPGVEQRFLVMALGIVEQPAAGLADEDAAEQAAARLARAGQQRRHHRPQRPAPQMLEGSRDCSRRGGNPPPGPRPANRAAARSGSSAGAPQREILSVLPLTTCTCQPCALQAPPAARRRRRRRLRASPRCRRAPGWW